MEESIRYGIRHPKRVIDYVLRARKISDLTMERPSTIQSYIDEFKTSTNMVHLRSQISPYKKMPLGTMLSPLRAPTLYAIVRATKPRTIVETGVANGVSSSVILQALETNGNGELHSIDFPNIDPGALIPSEKDVGWLVPSELRSRWRLRLGQSKYVLRQLLEELKAIDMFFHDSDHSYENMKFELATSFEFIREGGFLIADDIQDNSAFYDFLRENSPLPWISLGGLGVAKKNSKLKRGEMLRMDSE
jgi:predicted O-methyltransferase YrrM